MPAKYKESTKTPPSTEIENTLLNIVSTKIMANEKFNWKSLFINEEEEPATEETAAPKAQKRPVKSAPSSGAESNKFPQHLSRSTVENSNILNNVIEMYESGFDSLNQPGYDFYEFFKAIKAVGSGEPQVYKMAFTMASSVDPKVSKNKLLEEADFYIQEIEKVHQQYEVQGSNKKAEIQSTQKTRKDNLTSEISALEKKLMEIQNQISTKKTELQSIDVKLVAEVAEIDQKMVANDQAKTKILETIMEVVTGIKNNL